MAFPILPVLLGAAGFIALTRRRRQKASTTTSARERRIVDQGRALSNAIGSAVDWDVYRQGLKFGWIYSVVGRPESLTESPPAYGSEADAYDDLDNQLDLDPLPVPEGTEEPDVGTSDPDDPDAMMGDAASWHAPPPGSLVYPPGEKAHKAPSLDDPEGASFAGDCSVVVVGPDWWDKVGDIVVASGLTDPLELEDVVLQTEFPPGCDLSARGAARLRSELRERIQAHLSQ